MKGNVFEIQKFALHDGPGIRTVVFLKGCPLRCKWCSNPESFKAYPQLSYTRSKCTNCNACIAVCKQGVFESITSELNVSWEKCSANGDCINECIPDALKLYGWEAEASEILMEVVKDKAYFTNSGGGITLSGGEPMAQPAFAKELLSLAKEQGIHTCIETSGYAAEAHFKEILPYTDLFLYDYKITGDEEHKKYTSRSNEKILANLDYLARSNASIILRCPVIPGINDTNQHFRAIASLSNTYTAIQQVEIMPYHDWGSHKYEQLGMKPYSIDAETVEENEAEQWRKKLKDLDCHKVKPG